jgi:ankyrin repeat protein
VKEKGLQVLWPDRGFEWEGPSHERLKRCCTAYLHHPSVRAVVNRLEGGDDDQDATAENCSFLEYASQQVLHHADAAALVIPQDDFLSQFFASGGIGVVNLFERFKSQRGFESLRRFQSQRYGLGATPLYVLADKGLGNLIRTQMKRESTAYVPGERYEHPLFAALAKSHQDAVAALLDWPSTTHDGVDITKDVKYGIYFTEYEGRTPLSWAAQEGRLAIVTILIHRGANLDEADKGRHTPLLRAVKSGHEAVAGLLINKGADVHAKDTNGSTALILALENGLEAAARLLIDKGADVHAKNKYRWTALLSASRDGNEAVGRLLIDKGADVHAKDTNGSTVLILALENGHEAVARLLIDKGADVDAKGSNGSTALILASEKGHEAVARLLIDKGADVHAKDSDGSTALILALKKGYEAVARLLRGVQRE